MLSTLRQRADTHGIPPAERLPAICFVATRAYAALSRRDDVAHVGGAERQQVLLAHELSRRGHRVSFVVLDHGQSDGERVPGGIRAHTCYRHEAGWPGVRFFHPRLRGLWAAMRRAGADVYYQRGADAETGLVARWCLRHGRAFVFSTAHDTNCLARSPLLARRSDRLLFRYGLRRADAVIVQTVRQHILMRHELGVSSTVVPNCIAPGSSDDDGPSPSRTGVLWVGRLSEEKRPEWLAALARAVPDCRFDIAGHCNDDSRFGRRLAGELQSLANVRWHGYVPHHRMAELYRGARTLLCTSESEGFPNVFLEAWACGTPVLSTVDPDGVIDRHSIGVVATDLKRLTRELAALDSRAAFWDEAGRRGRSYVESHHTVHAAADALARVVTETVARREQAGAV